MLLLFLSGIHTACSTVQHGAVHARSVNAALSQLADNNVTYAVSEPVGTLLAESNWRLHVAQHVVHVRIVNPSAATVHAMVASN